MQIIFLPDPLGRPRSLRLGGGHLALLLLLLAAVLSIGVLLGWQWSRPSQDATLVQGQTRDMDLLAERVGELQARFSHLRTLAEQIAQRAGIDLPATAATPFPPPGGQGGPLITSASRPIQPDELLAQLDMLAWEMEQQADHLRLARMDLLERQLRRGNRPLARPAGPQAYLSSNFGWREDPFTRRMARHEGIDYSDAQGAVFMAAESGVVTRVGRFPEYGLMLEIDHGNGLTTRYGHAQRILVREGDIVRAGQPIGEIGSTGRSTGPHLHFEVLRDGLPGNPLAYLRRPA